MGGSWDFWIHEAYDASFLVIQHEEHDPWIGRCQHQVSCSGHRPADLLRLDPDQCQVLRKRATVAAIELVYAQSIATTKKKVDGATSILMEISMQNRFA